MGQWHNAPILHPTETFLKPQKMQLRQNRNRWSRHNHQFNPIKTNRYKTLNANLTDMNKINIIQPVPKKACE